MIPSPAKPGRFCQQSEMKSDDANAVAELEEKNIIKREVFAEVPPKVVYSLTPIGLKLKPVLKEMFEWGIEYVKENGKNI